MTIKKNDEFEAIYPTLNLNGLTFIDIVNQIEQVVVRKATQSISQGSLNNCRGTWNELAFLMEAHRSIIQATKNLYLVKMNSETSIKFWEIYQKESRRKYDLLIDIFRKREEPIFIRCSTPDFVVIRRDVIQDSPVSNILQNPSPPLKEINELYKVIKNKCLPHQVKGFISLKTSNRPDRRYQILSEANVTKFASRYIHNSDHKLRYDVIGKSNLSDREVFSAPLMFTLPKSGNNVTSVERAVDSEVNIRSGQELDEYWERYEENYRVRSRRESCFSRCRVCK